MKEEDGSESGTVRGPGSEAGTVRNSRIEAASNGDLRRSQEVSSPRLHEEPVKASRINGGFAPSKARESRSSSTTQGLRPRTASDTDKDLPPTPSFSSPYLSENPESLYDREEFGARSSIDTRLSSNSARPSARDLDRAYDYNRPKIKLGPRPSMDSATRPDIAHSGSPDVRPVASLPAGIRMPARKAVAPRLKSQSPQKVSPLQIPKIPSQGSTPAPPPVTPTSAANPFEKRPSEFKISHANPAKKPDVKSPKMTPEKRRLMKALQIRQKHLAAQNAAKSASNEPDQESQVQVKKENEASSTEIVETVPVEEVQTQHSQEAQPRDSSNEMLQSEDQDPVKEISRDVQDSPVSVPEPSDGPSTQASSIMDEEVSPAPNQVAAETKMPLDVHHNQTGLEAIIRDETQGPVISVRSDTPETSDEIVERPITMLLDEKGKEPAQSSSLTQGPSSSAIQNHDTRDAVQTLSISSTSSEHTMTDKNLSSSMDIEHSTEQVQGLDTVQIPNHESNLEEKDDKSQSHLLLADHSKQGPEDSYVSEDIEEPESPFLIEGHSVQTSASPSVVNLLDGLAATTHNESTAPVRQIETPAPIQAQQPSLFNMVGAFGGSGESLESPLSAVREEAEMSPSPSQIELPAVRAEDLPQRDQVPPKTNNENQAQSEGSSAFAFNEKRPQVTRMVSESTAEGADQVAGALPARTVSDAKTRPRTTSKTFQFPSKSRSSSHGEKPPSLDLSKDAEQMRAVSDVRQTHTPQHSTNNSQIEITPKEEQQTQPKAQPEARTIQHLTTEAEHAHNAKQEHQSDTQSTGVPVPDALSHASSKALKLLGFSPDQPEPQSDGPTGLSDRNGQSAEAAKDDSKTRMEASTSDNGTTQVDSVSRHMQLPEDRSAEFQGVRPASPPDARQTKESVDDAPTSNLTSTFEKNKQTERQARRRGVVEPPRRELTPEPSDEQFLSDDSFMEELKTATVQEAKPISVSRSPIKPGFLGSEGDTKVSEKRESRNFSPLANDSDRGQRSASSPRPLAAVSLRSFSGTIPPRPDVKTPPGPQSAQPKKFGVSSGITQRIKALEVKSSRPNSPSIPTPTTPGFLNFRKPSFNTELNGAGTSSRRGSTYNSPQMSPEIGKLDPLNRSVTPRGESVSVTATIVRDPGGQSSWPSRDAGNTPTVSLHESPLIVERQNISSEKQQVMGPPQFSPLKPPRPRYSRYSSARSASSSSTEQKTDGPPHSRRNSTASKRSGRSSRNNSDVDLPRTLSDRSLSSSSQLGGIKEEKKESRSSRLIKRMSSLTSISRRSIAQAISPSPREGSIIERQHSIAEPPAFSAFDMGDINIQFPDTLLWKRRHMMIDQTGIIELTASKADKVSFEEYFLCVNLTNELKDFQDHHQALSVVRIQTAIYT